MLVTSTLFLFTLARYSHNRIQLGALCDFQQSIVRFLVASLTESKQRKPVFTERLTASIIRL
jgi:hypothetical protein